MVSRWSRNGQGMVRRDSSKSERSLQIGQRGAVDLQLEANALAPSSPIWFSRKLSVVSALWNVMILARTVIISAFKPTSICHLVSPERSGVKSTSTTSSDSASSSSE
eukprot:6603840-Prymnesium_polylepis.1